MKMTIATDNTNFSVYVTHVEAEGKNLLIFGQTDHASSVAIEAVMEAVTPLFTQGHGTPTCPSDLQSSGMCCAMFEGEYYRARIQEIHPSGTCLVKFVDYGNTELVQACDIRILGGIPEANRLTEIPWQVTEYTLSGVSPIGGAWDERIVSSIQENLRYSEWPARLVNVNETKRIIKVEFNKQDLGTFLVSKNMALPMPTANSMREQICVQPPAQHPPPQMMNPIMQTHENQRAHQVAQEGSQSYAGARQNSPPSSMQRGQHYQATPNQENWRVHPPPGAMQLPPSNAMQLPPTGSMHYPPPRHQQPIVVQEPCSFRTRILDIGSQHEVRISYVENGPLMFAVQTVNTMTELKILMESINAITPQPLAEPPLIGSVCLGRCTANKLLLRAVVGKVTENCCKVHYIDYGNSEVLPYTEIFHLPRQFTNLHVLSIRFTLSNTSELNVTEEMKEYFKSIVGGGKVLLLHVRPSEGSPLIQHGELYDNGKNVKDILSAAFPTVTPTWPPPCALDHGAKEIVIVMYVESCSKFFIQLDTDGPALDKLRICIDEYVKTAPPFKPSQLQQGLRCIALSSTDSQWYRAEITKLSGDCVNVFYVDYGNSETIPATSIRSIRDSSVTRLRAQAIRCILNGYEREPASEEMNNRLEEEILSKRIAMAVVNVIPAGPIVDLYDMDEPMTNILYRLKGASNGNAHETYNDRKQNSAISNINARLASDDQINKWGETRAAAPSVSEMTSPADNSQWNNRKEETIDQRRFDNRGPNPNAGHQNDRFARDDGRNERFSRDGPRQERNDRFDRSGDSNGNVRGGRDNRGGRADKGVGNSRFPANNSKLEKNGNLDKSWSDKDSDTSSRGSGKNGRRGSSGGRGGRDRRDGGNGKTTTGRDNDGDSDRSFKSNSRSNGSRITRDFGNEGKQMDNGPSKSPEIPTSIRIPPANITIGAVKNCDMVFVTNPTDFHVQLSPDNVELEAVMLTIASTYEDGGQVLQRSSIKQGIDCIAQYSEDSQWYRATVQNVDNDGATVRFVDYGNVETVDFKKIKQITPDCARLPAQAIGCKLLAASKTTWNNEETDKFTDLADGKKLEAEFVAQENGVYEILLREIVNNSSSVNYINDQFSDGTDLAQAKQAARNRGKPGIARSPAAAIDYAPINEKWSVASIDAGSKQNVEITWFTNPDNFYCQLQEQKNEFTAMMHEIQRVYPTRKPINEPLQVGSAVIAVFAEDDSFYRAEILELNKARGNIVRYIDFGNCAMVEPRQTYRVEKRFMKLPKQAVHCSLKNVVPANGTSWSKANREDIDKCFILEKIYDCSFHEIKDGKHFVSLSTDGIDVAGLMVDKSLASFAVSQVVAADNNASLDTANQSPVAELPRFDISLLAGQVLRVKVSNVSSVTKFHVQLPSAAASDSVVDSYMADKDPKVMPRLSRREVCLGAGCLVKTNEGWRRAVVVNCSRTTGFDVRLIDTGANDEKPLDCMLALPGQLAVMQNQAVECCIKNATSSSKVDEQLRNRILNTNVIVAIDEVDNNRLIVELYDLNGNKIKLSDSEADARIGTICPMPVLNSSHQVTVTHAEHSGSVWLKRVADMDADAELLTRLFDFYSAQGDQVNPEPGIYCAALSSDGNWYRATILQPTETGVLVHFLDYGNTEDIAVESLRVLDPQFHEQSQMAVEASLMVTLAGSKEEQQEILREHIVDQEFTATFFSVRKKWIIELTNDAGKISEKFTSMNVVQASKNQTVLPTEVPEMIVGGRYKVICPHADTPAQFWLQREEETTMLDLLQEKLQTEAPGYPALEGVPEISTQCIALYSVDEQWYRAEVLDADEDITTIRFIDYGNTDIVDANTGKIKQIPDSLKATKRYAIRCRLDVIPCGADDWTSAASEWFSNTATTAENIDALVIADSTPKRVELFFGDRSAVDELVERNYATKINTEADLCDEFVDRIVDPRAAYVCHAVSPREFSVQEDKNVAELEVLADRFLVADMLPKLEVIKEGMLCVAKFPEDGLWYRARIISHAGSGTEVIYIDYGNSAISTEIRAIPEDLAKSPPLSKRCCLALPEGVEQWSEKAETEFVELAADGETTFLLDILKEEEDISVVKLTVDGEDIVDRLKELCEKTVVEPVVEPVVEERLPPLGEENSPNVVVSNINSPSEFWTQAESAIADLELMAEHLASADSFLSLNNMEEGTICAAEFPEDGLWYRAKVLSHGDAGTEVFYIDYGNSAITTKLRVLPEDIVNIPALSTRCSLRIPDDVECWSQEASEKFFELVADGSTMFQYEILEDKEQLYISLSLEGQDIVEILAPLCAKTIQKAGLPTTGNGEQLNDQQTVPLEETISEAHTSSINTSGVVVTNAFDSSTTLSSFSKMESSSEFANSSATSTMLTSKSQTVATITSVASIIEVNDSSTDDNGSELPAPDSNGTQTVTFDKGASKDYVPLRRPQSSISSEIVSSSSNGGNDLVKNSDVNLDNETRKSTIAITDSTNIKELSPIPTTKLSISEKIVAASESRDDFVIGEQTCPSTPKKSHSEN